MKHYAYMFEHTIGDVGKTKSDLTRSQKEAMCNNANHTLARVVRECCKGGEASQWIRPKFDPRHTKTP